MPTYVAKGRHVRLVLKRAFTQGLLSTETKRTLSTPDMDEMSSPKRHPPIHAKVPTTYCVDINACLKIAHCQTLGRTGLDAILALYCR